MDAQETDQLESVLEETATLIAGVRPEQAHLPTPCPDLDVTGLVDHLTGWAGSFAARLAGATFDGEPNEHRAGPDPSKEFRSAAAEVVGAYRSSHGPADQMPPGVLLMEFVTHGWDLATATSQPVPYDEAAAAAALAAGRQMLKPEYRGPGMTFGPELQPAPGAGAVEQLVAFLGRDPGWTPQR